MKPALLVINILVSLALIILILIQGKGAGLGSAWGGGGEFFQSRRGLEKITLRLTVILIAVFLVVSLLNLFVK